MNKRIISFVTIFFCFLSSVVSSEVWTDLVERNGVYYKKFSDTPFTGEIISTKRHAGFKNGKKHGFWSSFYDNGGLWFKTFYNNGKKDGAHIFYYENGQLFKKGQYKNNLPEGTWETYHENGQLGSRGKYKKGMREGFWVMYWNNGAIHTNGKFLNGKKEGHFNSWNFDKSRNHEEAGIFKEGIKIRD